MTVRMTSMFHDSDSLHHHNNSHNQVSPGSTESSPRSSSALIHQAYNWFYDKAELKSTPSILDGIPYDRERRYRNEGARFILNVGSQMKLRYTTLATGVVYFHRFYMFHSFRVFPRYVTAACCLFLAGKAEETPKKCKDIIKIARTQLTDNQFATFGEDPKEEVLTMERIVLQTIRFDLQVDHPYKYLINYAKGFKGNKEKINQILQMAWTFTNDSLSTTICLQWEPEIVAIAMIFLASKIKYEITDWEGRLPSQKHWWDIYVEDLTVEMLEDVCHQVLDLYQKPRDALELKDSPPMSPVQKRLPPAGAQSHALVVRNLQAPPPPPPERPPPPPPSNTTPASAPPHALPLSLPPSAIPIRLLGPAAVVANGAHAAAGALPAPPPPPPPPPIPPLGIGSQWDSFFNHPVIPPFPFPGTNASAGGPPGPPPHLPPGIVPPAPGMHARLPPPPPIALPGTLPRGPPPPLPPTLASFVAGQRNH